MKITAVNTVIGKPQASPEVDNGKKADFSRLKKACEQFESLFIYYMLKTMRSASEKSSLFGDGLGADVYSQLFDEGLADKMAENGPFGIGDMLMKTYAKQAGLSEDEYKTYDSAVNNTAYSRPYIKVKSTEIKPSSNLSEHNRYDTIIEDACKAHNVDSSLIKAVIMQESGGNPKAVSSKGAKGLMQLMDGTAQMLGITDPFDIRQNIFGGVKYLAGLISKFGGDLKKALAAYNAGPTVVEKYDGIPPFEETKKYVNNIMGTFQSLYNSRNTR
jgi:soluble lytic murein transglycosylase-like protein